MIPVNQRFIFCFFHLAIWMLMASSVFGQENSHTIKSGETLSSIAKKYKTTVAELQRLNPDAAKGIKAGAVIKLPGSKENEVQAKPAPHAEANQETAMKHKVAAGESLFKIAKKYKVNVRDLEQWNGIANSGLKAGTEIWVSNPGFAPDLKTTAREKQASEPETETNAKNNDPQTGKHVVSKGQTLSTIARQYKTTVGELKEINQLKTNNVKLGQTLIVPSPALDLPVAKEHQTPNPRPLPLEKIKEKIEEAKPVEKQTDMPEKGSVASAAPAQEAEIVKDDAPLKSGIREINNALGYTRVVETGFAEAIEGDGNSKKHLCLHKSAPIGSILQVKNEMNGQSVFVKVIGKLPDTGSNEKLIIRISRQAYDRLLAVGKRFPVEVSYPQAQP